MPARAFLLLLVRCSATDARSDWEQWWDEVHAPELARLLGATAVERWRADAADPVAHTGTGWTDAAFVHLPGDDAAQALDRLEAAWPDLWADDRIHERHVLNGVEAFTGHGPSGTLAPPHPDRTGRILAMVRCTDPGRSAEWDRWYEDQHLPDMLATGAFAAGSRWRRERTPALAPAHATLYDVAGIPLADAVARSAAAMPGLVAAGRKPSWHTGGLTMTLVPG
jgi:hypothetical protein